MEHVSTVVNRVLDDAGICTQCYKVPCQCDALYEKHLDNQMFPEASEAEEYDQLPPDEEEEDDEDDSEAYEEGEDEDEDEDWFDEDEEWEEED